MNTNSLKHRLQLAIDTKTKPVGSLGRIEKIALQLGMIFKSEKPQLRHPTIIVFAGDHGIACENVSAYPQDVTWQMVYNFVNKGAAINVLADQNNISVIVVDAGVNHDFPADLPITHAKIGYGTNSFLETAAMSMTEVESALAAGKKIINQLAKNGCNVVGFGEMGIGNSSSATMLMALSCNLPIASCVGRGTGLDESSVAHKITILEQAILFHQSRWQKSPTTREMLAAVGGYEIAQMVGGMLAASENEMAILVDGFISTAAFLVAYQLNPQLKEYAFFAHQSDEKGHQQMLDFIGVQPLLALGLRLGEGTGAALAYPLLTAATAFLENMASFESAQIDGKSHAA